MKALCSDRGNAPVEFVVLAVVLLIPTIYLVLTLGAVQSAVLAADVVARDAARIHATEQDPGQARSRQEAHMRLVLDDYGIRSRGNVEITCSEDPCARPGGTVRATVRIAVPVPGLGPVLGQDGPVRVGAEHMVQVDQFRDPGASGGPVAREDRR